MATITQAEYDAARSLVEAKHRQDAEMVAAQKEALTGPVTAVVETPEFREIYRTVRGLIADYPDDGAVFSNHMIALAIGARNLAAQVGIDLDAMAEQPAEDEAA